MLGTTLGPQRPASDKGLRVGASPDLDALDKDTLDEDRLRLSEELASRVLELAKANQELETFSYTVSHDLRTPLTVLENYAHILLAGDRSSLRPEQLKALEGIRTAVARMALLVENILRLSRVSRTEIHPGRTDLADLARQVVAELRERDPKRQVAVDIPAHAWADADERLLRIALANLLGNAWKFTGRTPEARISFAAEDRDGRHVFVVRDNGPGFDMKDAGKLFQLFQRLDSGAGFPGTGIGLVTVDRAIARHGGSVWAESSPGKGASFCFTLPAHQAPADLEDAP